MALSGFKSQVSTFQYDDLDRLIGESCSGISNQASAIAYGYDLVGNLLTKTSDGGSVAYTYSNGCNRLTGWTATSTNAEPLGTNGSYLYNDAGCVTNIAYSGSGFSQSIGLNWNSQYQLAEVTTNGVSVERNGFDALGRRVWNWDGSVTNFMVYDGVHVLAEVDSTGGLRRAYTHGPGIDNWLAMTVYTGATAKTYLYLTDHLGTVHALADTNGVIVRCFFVRVWPHVTTLKSHYEPPFGPFYDLCLS